MVLKFVVGRTADTAAALPAKYSESVARGPMRVVLATGFPERRVLAFLGTNCTNAPTPVTVGDTVSAGMEGMETKELLPRDDAGGVIDATVTSRDDGTVFEGDATFTVKRRN